MTASRIASTFSFVAAVIALLALPIAIADAGKIGDRSGRRGGGLLISAPSGETKNSVTVYGAKTNRDVRVRPGASDVPVLGFGIRTASATTSTVTISLRYGDAASLSNIRLAAPARPQVISPDGGYNYKVLDVADGFDADGNVTFETGRLTGKPLTGSAVLVVLADFDAHAAGKFVCAVTGLDAGDARVSGLPLLGHVVGVERPAAGGDLTIGTVTSRSTAAGSDDDAVGAAIDGFSPGCSVGTGAQSLLALLLPLLGLAAIRRR